MNLQWSEELAVGHPVIDEQHRQLFKQFEAFIDACDRRQGLGQLRILFGFLDGYVTRHFKEEEALMKKHGYPDLDHHRQEHRIFMGKLEALKKELQSAGPTIEILVRTNKTLLYWLTVHIREIDTRVGAYLLNQPLENKGGEPI